MRSALCASIVVVWGFACVGAVGVARAQTIPADSLGSAAAAVPTTGAGYESFDRITRGVYLRRHAFSLDHFLEFEPGGFVVRLGPIGNDAAYSRWGIGRGRALLRINGIAMNDPQDDSPPLVYMPTSGLGTLSLNREKGTPWIEGVLELEEAPPPSGRPNTFVELSKGTNALRQRRVRFSSEASKIGIDLAYDEVLDDGYEFDASGDVPYVSDYGRARTRNSTIVVRGDPDATTRFDFGVRNFTASNQGDLVVNDSEGRTSGHVTWLDAKVAETKLTLFARGYSSSVPDSVSESETVGALANWTRRGPGSSEVVLRAGIERLNAIQDVGVVAENRVVRATGGFDAARRIGGNGRVTGSATVAGDDETPFAWGASVSASRVGQRHTFQASLARSFRLANIGERYLPAHSNGTFTLAGNHQVDPETAWEVGGDWEARIGVTNRVRAAWIQSDDAIAFRPTQVGAETWRVAGNAADTRSMLFLEERVSGDWDAIGLRILADAAAVYTTGDREDAFASVPELTTHASILFGRDFFETTSALFLGGQFMSCDDRTDFDGNRLPAFQVLNLILEGRLLDARIYIQYLNVMDEAYQTQGGYLMTPRTFVYGIEWTLFD